MSLGKPQGQMGRVVDVLALHEALDTRGHDVQLLVQDAVKTVAGALGLDLDLGMRLRLDLDMRLGLDLGLRLELYLGLRLRLELHLGLRLRL